MATAKLLCADPSGELLYTFDWSDDIPAGATLQGVVVTAPSPLVKFHEAFDAGTKLSTVGLRGFVHGHRYDVQALATLSNNEKVPQTITVFGFNG